MGESQNIPLGRIGGAHAIRRPVSHSRWRPLLERWHVGATICGLGATLTGWSLSSAPPRYEVALTAAAYRIDSVVLERSGQDQYTGTAAALILEGSGGSEEAAASTMLDGRSMTGQCHVTASGNLETCRFRLGGSSIDAVDVRRENGWNRTYGDGRRVDIDVVAGSEVPVPFALGR